MSRKGTGLWTRVGWIYGLNKEPTMWAITQKTSTEVFLLRFCCGATGNRTRDTRIFSPLLYQLSYGTRIYVSNVLFSFGIAKVDIFSLPPNFSVKNFTKNVLFSFFADFSDFTQQFCHKPLVGKVAHNHLPLNTLPKPPAPLLRQEHTATNYGSTT